MTIKEPKISKLEVNLNHNLSEKIEISVNIFGNISIPKDISNNYCSASETVEVFLEDKTKIILIEMKSPVIYDKDSKDSLEEKNKKIEKEAFPILYKEIYSILTFLFNKLPIKFPPLPEKIDF